MIYRPTQVPCCLVVRGRQDRLYDFEQTVVTAQNTLLMEALVPMTPQARRFFEDDDCGELSERFREWAYEAWGTEADPRITALIHNDGETIFELITDHKGPDSWLQAAFRRWDLYFDLVWNNEEDGVESGHVYLGGDGYTFERRHDDFIKFRDMFER